MHASFPSNIQPINAVHMAYKTLGSWQNMVGRVFGIHPYIAENQPHEVRTLGMNHPVVKLILTYIHRHGHVQDVSNPVLR